MVEPIFVTDIETLRRMCETKKEKAYMFVRHFLVRQQEKLYVFKADLDAYVDEMEDQNHLSQSLRDNARNHKIARLRGWVVEYHDPTTDSDERDETLKIVERNYATVKYFIVESVDKYRRMVEMVDKSTVMSPSGFMYTISADPQHEHFVREFNDLYSQLPQ